MSFYRNTYLKSEDWKSLRACKIAHVLGRCNLCGLKSDSNDVHHLKYHRLYDVSLTDLRVLCRKCHDRVHDLLGKYPKLKRLKRYDQWVSVKLHFSREERYDSIRRSEIGRRTQSFGRIRNELVRKGIVYRFRMKCSDEIVLAMEQSSFSKTEDMLLEYIRISGNDPRRDSRKALGESTHETGGLDLPPRRDRACRVLLNAAK